jgi:hypothetical protein
MFLIMGTVTGASVSGLSGIITTEQQVYFALLALNSWMMVTVSFTAFFRFHPTIRKRLNEGQKQFATRRHIAGVLLFLALVCRSRGRSTALPASLFCPVLRLDCSRSGR